MQDPAVKKGRHARYDERNAAVADAMLDEPTAFEFYQLVRLLLRLNPERAGLGRWADPAQEIVRIRAHNSLGFPASEIQELAAADDRLTATTSPVEVTVNFFGLTGPQGVLPHLYTEHALSRARSRQRDTAFRDFLDIFNHRATSLLVRAWEKGKPTVSHERESDDRPLEHLLDVVGMGTAGLRDRLPLRDEAMAFYAGLLSSQARSADGLARLVSDYFDVPASVEQFVGDWKRLDAGGQVALGGEGDDGRLGFGMLGDAGWDPQSRVRLRLGPLSREQFDSFVAGGAAHDTLQALVMLYVDDMVGVDAQLVLSRTAVRPCVLEVPNPSLGVPASGPRLGRGTWLASRPLGRDPDETTLRLC